VRRLRRGQLRLVSLGAGLFLLAAAACTALPPPTGHVVTVATVAELQAAVADLAAGTTVLIADGTYPLERTLHIRGGVTNVALRGASGDRDAVVLVGRGMRNADHANVPHGVLVSDATDVQIADLTIRDVYYHAVQIQGEQGARRVRLYNLHLLDAGEQLVKGSSAGPPGPYADDGEVACSRLEYTDRARSYYTNGVDVLAGANWVVRDNDFVRIRAPIGELAGPAVLFWRNAIGTVVERNRFVDCDRAIALGLAPPDPSRARDGDRTYDHQGGIVRNNTISRAPGAPTGDIGITVNYARDFQVHHNTVILNGTFPWGAIEYRFAPSTGAIRNNLTDAPIWRRDEASAVLDGNVTDAQVGWFADAGAGDLHLRAGVGAAVDRATVLANVADDMDAEARPVGRGADVGADEVAAQETPPTTGPAPATVTPTTSATASPAPTNSTPTTPAPAPVTRVWLPVALARGTPRAPVPPRTVTPPPATAVPSPTHGTTAAPSRTPDATTVPSVEPTRSVTPFPSSPTPTATAPGCGDVPTFADDLAPRREVHVATTGSDAAGDGSAARPYASVSRATRGAQAGTAIRIHAGTYAGGQWIEDLRGTADAPIWIGGVPGEPTPVIEGGGEGMHLVRPAWVVVHDLAVRSARDNGINADDGGDYGDATAAHHLVFQRIAVSDVGGTGNQDCLKLSGVNDLVVVDAAFARCGGGMSGSGIDMVGVHHAVIARSTFREHSGNAVQVKGGSADIEIRWNRMTDAGERAVNMGGSTGFEYFRPPLSRDAPNAEARDIRVVANLIERGVTPLGFVGCVDCLAAHNTVVDPEKWLLRILQETTSQGGLTFEPSGNGDVVNNLFVFTRARVATEVNIGPNTAPGTFTFAHNLWYARDNPGRSRPTLPAAETGGVSGLDPLLDADAVPGAGSPAIGAGIAVPGVRGDLAGSCYRDPPSIGAREGGRGR
jgi:hypothetical protein